MKRLLNPTGGRPLKNEDAQLYEQLIDNQEVYFENLNGGSPVIVQGMDITPNGGNWDISAGVIYYANALCTFAGITNVSLPYLMEKTVTDGTNRLFFDAVSKATIRETTVAFDAGGGLSFDANTARLENFGGTLQRKLLTFTGWDMDAVTDFTVAHGLDSTKIVALSGLIIISNSGSPFAAMGGDGTLVSDAGFGGSVVRDAWDATNINLTRTVAGFYDTVGFNAATGSIIVEYTS